MVTTLLLAVEVAVIRAVPVALAVTRPLEDTEATEDLSLVHLTDGSVSAGEGAAVSWSVSPFSILVTAGEMTILEGEGSRETVTLMTLFLELLRTEEARISAVPGATAVTNPVEDTVATLFLLVAHFTSCEALAGRADALSW